MSCFGLPFFVNDYKQVKININLVFEDIYKANY